MHDLFHILGVPAGAGPGEIRQASDRRVRRWHPDLDGTDGPLSGRDLDDRVSRGVRSGDAAFDFVDMRAVVDRIHADFFHSKR